MELQFYASNITNNLQTTCPTGLAFQSLPHTYKQAIYHQTEIEHFIIMSLNEQKHEYGEKVWL